jgi:hypothetical protein
MHVSDRSNIGIRVQFGEIPDKVAVVDYDVIAGATFGVDDDQKFDIGVFAKPAISDVSIRDLHTKKRIPRTWPGINEEWNKHSHGECFVEQLVESPSEELLRSSTAIILYPAFNNSNEVCDPMYPNPPVTGT